MNTVRSAAQRIRESLFFVPLLIMGICGALAWLVLYIDTVLAEEIRESTVLLAATVEGGRSIVTTVAGATITVAAIVFSITALSSQIAANQYSPRAVSGFFEDTFQQMIIGLIVGTFTYCLLILGGLSSSLVGVSEPRPTLAITVAVVLGVGSAIGIVAYIDHSLRRFQVDSVVRRISNATLEAIKRNGQERKPDSLTETPPPSGESHNVSSKRSGWVQAIDAPRLAESLPEGSTARVAVRLGEPLSSGDKLLTIWPPPDDEDRVQRAANRHIRAGRDRSLDNDPSFGIRQLVDIALKALSPGINDPTTAVDVIHHLKVPIREILQRDPPQRVFNGSQGQRVFLAESLSRSGYVHSAFSEIRLAAGSQPTVLHALLEVLTDLRNELESEELPGRASAVEEEIRLTIDASNRASLPEEDRARAIGGFVREDREQGDG
ncbi:MAG: DUF2254 domain-containing protein [Actinobacteria bacterium]|nr:MAG: DUF2254 domain-containing protein [Actinomycetota bacterium]